MFWVTYICEKTVPMPNGLFTFVLSHKDLRIYI